MIKAARTRDPNNRGQEGISYHSGTPVFLSTEHKQSRAEAPAAEQSRGATAPAAEQSSTSRAAAQNQAVVAPSGAIEQRTGGGLQPAEAQRAHERLQTR